MLGKNPKKSPKKNLQTIALPRRPSVCNKIVLFGALGDKTDKCVFSFMHHWIFTNSGSEITSDKIFTLHLFLQFTFRYGMSTAWLQKLFKLTYLELHAASAKLCNCTLSLQPAAVFPLHCSKLPSTHLNFQK